MIHSGRRSIEISVNNTSNMSDFLALESCKILSGLKIRELVFAAWPV